MNKKIIGLIIALVVIIAAIVGIVILINNDSLNNNSNDSAKALGTSITDDNKTNTNEEKTENNTEAKKRVLIAYFSRPDENYNVGTVEVGNTEVMAGFIKDYLGENADAFKIDPVVAYPASYDECLDVATNEKNSDARPEFKNSDSLNLNNYDTIFIGYPIWWGNVPMIINTFLEKYDFSGKTIIPFNTHEGSGEAGTYSYIKNKMKSSTVNTNGLALTGKNARQETSRSTVENWLKELGY